MWQLHGEVGKIPLSEKKKIAKKMQSLRINLSLQWSRSFSRKIKKKKFRKKKVPPNENSKRVVVKVEIHWINAKRESRNYTKFFYNDLSQEEEGKNGVH